MPQYHFDCQRSSKPEDQLPGMECESGVLGGELPANTAAEAWARIVRLLCIPGVWVCRVRCGHRWLTSRTYLVELDGTTDRIG